jgi:hypothetical protein
VNGLELPSYFFLIAMTVGDHPWISLAADDPAYWPPE